VFSSFLLPRLPLSSFLHTKALIADCRGDKNAVAVNGQKAADATDTSAPVPSLSAKVCERVRYVTGRKDTMIWKEERDREIQL
jgi:hypothetical protein